MATAILVDGAFFLRRFKSCFPNHRHDDPASVAAGLEWLTFWHLAQRIGPQEVQDRVSRQLPLAESPEFYRLFVYDCAPLTKRMHWPISKRSINFAKTPDAQFRSGFHAEVQKLRKSALRLGRLSDTSTWRLRESATQRLVADPGAFIPQDGDFEVDTKQKGVDMRLGLDVASLAFKRQVDQIVIVAADADFVPAAKLARREGIDVVLDRMGDPRAASDLIAHVDAIRDCYCDAAHHPRA